MRTCRPLTVIDCGMDVGCATANRAERYPVQMNAAGLYVLLIDFCGAEPLLALMRGEELAGSEPLPERGAAAGWLPALKRLLAEQHLHLADLHAVGVVAGPGSFTGVRTGLAAAKGLCEAVGLNLVTVSRLAVLASASADANAVAILHAGRGQVYLRRPPGDGVDATEAPANITEVEAIVNGHSVVIAEPQLADLLAEFEPRLIQLGPQQILPLLQQELDNPTAHYEQEANYVRREDQIYGKPTASRDRGVRR